MRYTKDQKIIDLKQEVQRERERRLKVENILDDLRNILRMILIDEFETKKN